MKVSSNKVSDIYSHYFSRLIEVYSEKEASILLKRLMAHFVALDDYKIPDLAANQRVAESVLLKIHFGVKDLLKFRPLEYIISMADFYFGRFWVDENVLIPRPETEELIDYIWKNKNSLPQNPRGLDIGTGSGCIAISLAKLFSNQMFACDISNSAISIATKNSILHQVNVDFFQLDILNATVFNLAPANLDFIVSNPPYIRSSEKSLMKPNVLDFEPHMALFVPYSNPLIFYNAILAFAKLNLKPNGHIFLEINEFLAVETAEIFKNSYKNVFIINDLNDKPRFIHVF